MRPRVQITVLWGTARPHVEQPSLSPGAFWDVRGGARALAAASWTGIVVSLVAHAAMLALACSSMPTMGDTDGGPIEAPSFELTVVVAPPDAAPPRVLPSVFPENEPAPAEVMPVSIEGPDDNPEPRAARLRRSRHSGWDDMIGLDDEASGAMRAFLWGGPEALGKDASSSPEPSEVGA